MRTGILAAALLMLGAWQGPAVAQKSQDERIQKLEQRIRHQENRAANQDKAIVEKEREAKEAQAEKRFSNVEIGGTVEFEFVHETDYDGKSSNGLDVPTAELGVAAQMHDWVAGEVVLAWNDDDGIVEVDTATVTVARPDGMFSMVGGIQTLPFGTYEHNLLSDPLTLDIGEVGATALQFVMEGEGVSASAFVFKGANNRSGKDRIANYGVAVGFAYEGKAFDFSANAGYINDIAEAGSFQDSEDFNPDEGGAVAGAHASVMAKTGPVSLIGEYVAALKSFQGAELPFRSIEMPDPADPQNNPPVVVPLGAKPSAWSIEAALEVEMMDRSVTGAGSYQHTRQAVALGLPEHRYSFGVSVGATDNLRVGVEIVFDTDYSEADGGTGQDATAVTVQFAAEF